MTPFEKFQRLLITFLIAVSTFYGGFYAGKRGYDVEVKKNPPQIEILSKAPSKQEVDFSLFWNVWDILSTKYLERPVDAQKMVYGAIKGMVDSLEDPYTSFLAPVTNEAVNNSLNGLYDGIGAELGVEENQIIVISPLEGSPAKAAGLRPRDAILEIDGEATAGLTLADAVSKIRGPSGSLVALTVIRDKETEPEVIRIKRGQIQIDSLTWEDKGDGIAYLRLSRFGGTTNTEWDTLVSKVNVNMSEINAIIIDLRGNPGGYLQASVHLAGEFFRNKVVLYEENALGEQTPFTTNRVGVFEGIPLYVLIDGGSASASEILAAALRDNVGAVLIGTKSFGKGTIQDAQDFEDGSGLHITIAKWLTPSKEWVHKVGIEPDVSVEVTKEDLEQKKDPQLEKALEIARKGGI